MLGLLDVKKDIRNIKLTNTASQIKLICDIANNICEIPYYSFISPVLSSGLVNFRIKNLEEMVTNISEYIEKNENKINQEWYNEIEAIKILKKLIEEVEFEESKKKIELLSNVFVKFSFKENENNKNKIAIITKLAGLSISQIEILKSLSEEKIKCIKDNNRDITKNDLIGNLKTRGVFNKIEAPYTDLDILSSLGLIEWSERHSPSIFIKRLGEEITKYL